MPNLMQGEHGVGLGKRDCVMEELSEDTIAAMRRVRGYLNSH